MISPSVPGNWKQLSVVINWEGGQRGITRNKWKYVQNHVEQLILTILCNFCLLVIFILIFKIYFWYWRIIALHIFKFIILFFSFWRKIQNPHACRACSLCLVLSSFTLKSWAFLQVPAPEVQICWCKQPGLFPLLIRHVAGCLSQSFQMGLVSINKLNHHTMGPASFPDTLLHLSYPVSPTLPVHWH